MYVRHSRWPVWMLLSAFLFISLLLITQNVAFAGEPDVPLQVHDAITTCTDSQQPVGMVSGGAGTATGTGTFQLTIPGTPLKAYLYWSGSDDTNQNGGDPNVTFSEDSTSHAISAGPADTYGPSLWDSPSVHFDYTYRVDVTSYVHQGTHTYTLSGLEGFDVALYGTSLVVRYSKPAGSWPQYAAFASGQDLAEGDNGPSSGAGTLPIVYTFDDADISRVITLTTLAGGVQSGDDTEFWVQTGSGTPPTFSYSGDKDIYDTGTLLTSDALGSNNGAVWDNVSVTTAVPAGATWLAFQVRSATPNTPQLNWVGEMAQMDAACPRVAIQKTLTQPTDGTAVVGETVTYTLIITNTGNETLVTLPLTDAYDGTYLTYVSASPTPDSSGGGTIVWNDLTSAIGNLTPGNSATVTISFVAANASAPNHVTNTATISGAQDDEGDQAPDVSDDDTALVINSPGLNLTKSLQTPVGGVATVGDPVVFRILLENSGNTTITTLPLRDTYNSTCLTYVSANPTPDSVVAGQLDWNNLGPLAPSNSVEVTVNFTAAQPCNPAVNTASVHDAVDQNGDPVSAPDSSAQVIIVAPTATPTPTPTFTNTPTATLTPTPTPTSASTPTWTPTRASTGTPTPTPCYRGISGTVYEDANRNGALDSGEIGIGGVLVTLQGPVNAQTVTYNNGTYAFVGLSPGDYQITISVPAGWVSTSPNPLYVTMPADACHQITDQNFGLATETTGTPTPTPTITPTPTPTPTGVLTPTPTWTPTLTPTPTPTITPTPTPTWTPTLTPTATSIPTDTPTPTPTTSSPLPTPTPTAGVCIEPPDSYEVDNTMSAANLIFINEPPQDHTLHQVGDEDWVKFEGVVAQQYVITAQNVGSASNVTMELIDSTTSNVVASGDTSITFIPQHRRIYYLRIRPKTPDAVGCYTNYTVKVAAQPQITACTLVDGYEEDNRWEDAKPIPLDGSPAFHNFDVFADQDWHYFPAQAGTTYTITTFNLVPPTDTVLELYDTDGTTLLVLNDDAASVTNFSSKFGGTALSSGLASQIVWTAPSTGRYYFMVRDYTAQGHCSTYEVKLEAGPGQYKVHVPIVEPPRATPTPQPGGCIDGYKIDALHVGLPGWRIHAHPLGANTPLLTTTTDGTGYFRFENLTPGRWVLYEEMQEGWVPVTVPQFDAPVYSGPDCTRVRFKNRQATPTPTPTSSPYPTMAPTPTATTVSNSATLPYLITGGFDHVKGIAINKRLNRVYVASRDNNTLYVFNGRNDQGIAAIPVCREPFGVAVNDNNNKVYVACFAANKVAVIDGGSNTLKATINVGREPSWLAVQPLTNQVYVVAHGEDHIYQIDSTTDRITHIIGSDGGGPWGLAVNPALNRLYVGTRDSGIITTIDLSAHQVIHSQMFRPFSSGSPYSLAFNQQTKQLYVVGGANYAQVAVIKARWDGLQRQGLIAIDPSGYNGGGGLAVNSATNHVFVTSSISNSVAVIDGNTNTVIATFTTGNDPFAVAVNSNTNKVYIGNRSGQSVWVGEDNF